MKDGFRGYIESYNGKSILEKYLSSYHTAACGFESEDCSGACIGTYYGSDSTMYSYDLIEEDGKAKIIEYTSKEKLHESDIDSRKVTINSVREFPFGDCRQVDGRYGTYGTYVGYGDSVQISTLMELPIRPSQAPFKFGF